MAGQLRDYFVAYDDKKIVACAGFEQLDMTHAVFVNLAVQKSYRRQGIGDQLLSRMEQSCAAFGATEIAGCTMYYLYRFFKKREWRIVKRADLPVPFSTYWQFTTPRYMKCGVIRKSIKGIL